MFDWTELGRSYHAESPADETSLVFNRGLTHFLDVIAWHE
jgi:hypothetical protein